MTLDERTLRAAGLPASLISLLVSITKAADRAVAAANTASVANDLEPQIAAAVQALRDMEMAPGLATQIGTLANRLMQVEAVNPVVSLDREDNRLVLVMSDGSRIVGPKLSDAPDVPDQVPTVIGSIADRTYTVGQSVPATDLRTKFDGADSYIISPALNWVSIDGYNLTFDTSEALEETSFSVRGVNDDGQSNPLTFKLTVNVAQQAPALTAVVTPNPIVMGEPFTVEFNEEPDDLSSSVTLTGEDTTYSGTGPATSPASIGATKAGFTPYSATITVDTAVITPNAPITPVFAFEGKTGNDIPNIATLMSASNYTRTGRTIASVQFRINGVACPLNTVFVTGDVVDILVTDSGGTSRAFHIATVEYSHTVSLAGDGKVVATFNPNAPSSMTQPVVWDGVTKNIAWDDLTDGEELHTPPTLTDGGATWTVKRAIWVVDGEQPLPTIVRTIINAANTVVHTFADADFNEDTGEASFPKPTTAGDYRYRENCGGSIATTAPVTVVVENTGLVHLGIRQSSRASNSTDPHNLGTVTIPATGNGWIFVRGIIACYPFAQPSAATLTIGGTNVPVHRQAVDSYLGVFQTHILRSALPAGEQAIVITGNVATRFCDISVEYVPDVGGMFGWGIKSTTEEPHLLSVNTTPGGVGLGVFGQWRQSETMSDVTWTGLTERERITHVAEGNSWLVEFASHRATTTETPRLISTTNFNGQANSSRQHTILDWCPPL